MNGILTVRIKEILHSAGNTIYLCKGSNTKKLAQAVMELYRERTVRIYRGTQQYITEEQEWK